MDNQITTMRTEKKYYSYFNNKWEKFFMNRGVYGYLGHTHQNYKGVNFETIGSCGYDLEYLDIKREEGNIRVIADLHLGVPEVDKKFNKILKLLEAKKVKEIIFLGDTFDLALSKDSKLLKHEFWKWYNNTDKECVFIIGNHDINIIREQNNRVSKLISKKKGSIITREYYKYGIGFLHGDQYDPLVMFMGKFYLVIFQIYDYTGEIGYYLWRNIFEKMILKIKKLIDRKR